MKNPSLSRDLALETPLAELTEWMLGAHCGSCRIWSHLRVHELDRVHPGLTCEQVVTRLRCSRCGAEPNSVKLRDGYPGMGRSAWQEISLKG